MRRGRSAGPRRGPASSLRRRNLGLHRCHRAAAVPCALRADLVLHRDPQSPVEGTRKGVHLRPARTGPPRCAGTCPRLSNAGADCHGARAADRADRLAQLAHRTGRGQSRRGNPAALCRLPGTSQEGTGQARRCDPRQQPRLPHGRSGGNPGAGLLQGIVLSRRLRVGLPSVGATHRVLRRRDGPSDGQHDTAAEQRRLPTARRGGPVRGGGAGAARHGAAATVAGDGAEPAGPQQP